MSAVLSEITPAGTLAVEARHELLIPGPVSDVFEMTRNVERWTEYMPAVTYGAFVEQTDDGDVVEITAQANEDVHTWRSRRKIDRNAMTIEFSRIGATAPLVSMQGRWEFVPEAAGTRALLTHRYATTTPEALEFFNGATRSNATRDLEGLAEYFAAKEDVR
jgi:ribosome-associated toxin RatA of RatAB toxin-antitoxin module